MSLFYESSNVYKFNAYGKYRHVCPIISRMVHYPAALLIYFIGGGRGFRAFATPRFRWGSSRATCSTLKGKQFDISHRSLPVNFFFFINFTLNLFREKFSEEYYNFDALNDFNFIQNPQAPAEYFSNFFKTFDWDWKFCTLRQAIKKWGGANYII